MSHSYAVIFMASPLPQMQNPTTAVHRIPMHCAQRTLWDRKTYSLEPQLGQSLVSLGPS